MSYSPVEAVDESLGKDENSRQGVKMSTSSLPPHSRPVSIAHLGVSPPPGYISPISITVSKNIRPYHKDKVNTQEENDIPSSSLQNYIGRSSANNSLPMNKKGMRNSLSGYENNQQAQDEPNCEQLNEHHTNVNMYSASSCLSSRMGSMSLTESITNARSSRNEDNRSDLNTSFGNDILHLNSDRKCDTSIKTSGEIGERKSLGRSIHQRGNSSISSCNSRSNAYRNRGNSNRSKNLSSQRSCSSSLQSQDSRKYGNSRGNNFNTYRKKSTKQITRDPPYSHNHYPDDDSNISSYSNTYSNCSDVNIPSLSPTKSSNDTTSVYSSNRYSTSIEQRNAKLNSNYHQNVFKDSASSTTSLSTRSTNALHEMMHTTRVASISSTNDYERSVNRHTSRSQLLESSTLYSRSDDSFNMSSVIESDRTSFPPIKSLVQQDRVKVHQPVTVHSSSESTVLSHSNSEYKMSSKTKRREWMLRANRKLQDISIGMLDPNEIPINALMDSWAKTKSSEGADMVEKLLNRVQEEMKAGNTDPAVQTTTKMYTMAIDAWAKSGEGEKAAQRAEAILHHMHKLYQSGQHSNLKPTTGIFNAVINSWARSKGKNAPTRSEEILNWMDQLHRMGNLDVRPDKYTFNTVIHAWAKNGGKSAARRAQNILDSMHGMYEEGYTSAKPDTITYNIVIHAWANSRLKNGPSQAAKLLDKMYKLHEDGDLDIKPNVVTYCAVIDAYAKCSDADAASIADTILADMIRLYQSDPIKNQDLKPNTYIFNTCINCWAKSKERDAASKAEEMLLVMNALCRNGIPGLKPDTFTYTAVIDTWAKSGQPGAALRVNQLLNEIESKYQAGDTDLRPNTFTYNAVINTLAKSCEPGAAAKAENVLKNMVNRYTTGGVDDVKPTTINFNTVLDAWAKSRGGKAAAERAEMILEWMNELYQSGCTEIICDTISYNAVIDSWARSDCKEGPERAEQIFNYMNLLQQKGSKVVHPDSYTYNSLINAWAKSGAEGAVYRAEKVFELMNRKYQEGDRNLKPNTRTHTSLIDAYAKSGEPYAAKKAEQILLTMQALFERTLDIEVRPNTHTANAVMNACAFTKNDSNKTEALDIAFRVFDWISNQTDIHPDAYTFTIMLSVCSNLLPRHDRATRFGHASSLFQKCCQSGYVNSYVLSKLKQTITNEEFLSMMNYKRNASISNLPKSWTKSVKHHNPRMSNKSRRHSSSSQQYKR